MAQAPYRGMYCLFSTANKQEGGQLMGADNIIGDRYRFEFEGETAWLCNRFDKRIGFLDDESSRWVALCQAKDWHVSAVLVSILFTDRPEPGYYWGEVALMAYSKSDAAVFDPFVLNVAEAVADGIRVDVDLSDNGIDKVVDSAGTWIPTARVDKITLEHGTVYVKKSRSFTEKMVELARKRNIGCMIVGWAFLLAVIALIVFCLHSAGLF